MLAYSNARVAEWDRAWTNPDDPDRLVYYVPPQYSVVSTDTHDTKRPERRFPKRAVPPEEAMTEGEGFMQRVPGATEEETLTNLLQTSDRLCVSEGPGAGKSIFTRHLERLQLLSFLGQIKPGCIEPAGNLYHSHTLYQEAASHKKPQLVIK